MIKIYNMDVMRALKQMPDESVDMQITSPPYWGLRDYGEGTEAIWDGDKNCEHEWTEHKDKKHSGTSDPEWENDMSRGIRGQADWTVTSGFCSKCGAWKGQLGLEPDFNLYIKHLCDIFDEVKRVLKKDGTCWVNLGDTYSGGNLGVGQPEDWKSISTDNKGAGFDTNTMKNFVKQRNKMDYSAKCLCAIPERFMIEMIKRGWILRNKIIWHKPNHMPTSVKDRFASSWEYLFLFSKSKKYYFDLDAVREAHSNKSVMRIKRGFTQESINFDYSKRDKDKNYRKVYYREIEGMPQPGTPEYEVWYNEQREKKGWHDHENDAEQGFGQQKRGHLIRTFPHPKGKNPDDVIVHKQDIMASKNRNMYEGFNARYVPNPKGTIPDDIVKSKYIGTEGHSNRAGLQREPTLREKRIHEVIQNQIANYLKPKTKSFEKILDEEFGEHKWTHWIRTDESGASLPSPEDWWKLKEILEFDDTYDKIMTETEVYLDDGMMWKNKPKNPSDFWDITTRGYPEAHFAVFPEKLVERPIKTTKKDAVILDIFAGSGTTLKVARDLGRDSIGIEIKKEYVDLIKKRLFLGNQPLINDFEIIR